MRGRGDSRPQRETDKRQEKTRDRRHKKIRDTVPRKAYTAQDRPTKQKAKKQRHLTDECKTAGRKMSPNNLEAKSKKQRYHSNERRLATPEVRQAKRRQEEARQEDTGQEGRRKEEVRPEEAKQEKTRQRTRLEETREDKGDSAPKRATLHNTRPQTVKRSFEIPKPKST